MTVERYIKLCENAKKGDNDSFEVIATYWKKVINGSLTRSEVAYLYGIFTQNKQYLKLINAIAANLNLANIRKVALKITSQSHLGTVFVKTNNNIYICDHLITDLNNVSLVSLKLIQPQSNLTMGIENKLQNKADGVWEFCPIYNCLIRNEKLQNLLSNNHTTEDEKSY
jgi:hypothetical protein